MVGERSELLTAFREAVGDEHVLVDDDVVAPYCTDWTRRFVGSAMCVVRPGSVEEVAAVLSIANKRRVSVVPQGGNTGMVGGAVPEGDSVVVVTSRLRACSDLDRENGQLSVGAGTPLAVVQRLADSAGWRFGVDLGARDAATIGGMVATNAGGVSVIRHGMMRAHVVGIEAVLADGTVIRRMNGLAKDNTGFDFGALLCGSEGTLAIITAVRLRLVPRDNHYVTLGVGVQDFDAALAVVHAFRSAGLVLDAAEVVRRSGLILVSEHLNRSIPETFGCRDLLVAEIALPESGGNGTDRVGEVLESLASEKTIDPDLVNAADTPSLRSDLWAWRERHTESISARGIPIKLDISVPLHQLGVFAAEIDGIVASVCADATVFLFGHIGDGNLHVNVVGGLDHAHAIETAVLNEVVRLGGSISAEHGIGRAKKQWLVAQRGEGDVAAMKRIKAALDPHTILNPGVLFDS